MAPRLWVAAGASPCIGSSRSRCTARWRSRSSSPISAKRTASGFCANSVRWCVVRTAEHRHPLAVRHHPIGGSISGDSISCSWIARRAASQRRTSGLADGSDHRRQDRRRRRVLHRDVKPANTAHRLRRTCARRFRNCPGRGRFRGLPRSQLRRPAAAQPRDEISAAGVHPHRGRAVSAGRDVTGGPVPAVDRDSRSRRIRIGHGCRAVAQSAGFGGHPGRPAVDRDENNVVWFLAHMIEAARRIWTTLAEELVQVLEGHGDDPNGSC